MTGRGIERASKRCQALNVASSLLKELKKANRVHLNIRDKKGKGIIRHIGVGGT